jgi:hypothetical protein
VIGEGLRGSKGLRGFRSLRGLRGLGGLRDVGVPDTGTVLIIGRKIFYHEH